MFLRHRDGKFNEFLVVFSDLVDVRWKVFGLDKRIERERRILKKNFHENSFFGWKIVTLPISQKGVFSGYVKRDLLLGFK